MLETGAVRAKNNINILFKNILDASVAALGFWFIGYMFAYGSTAGGFIGIQGDLIFCQSIMNNAGISYVPDADGKATEVVASHGSDGFEGWFFQWAFAGAAATIVSGAVAERTKFGAYLIFSFVITVFIYPVVVHWGWGSGFLSAWGAMPDADGNARPILSGKDTSRGMIDFAGSGVVHMVGGVAGLMGAIVVGPRKGRFEGGQVQPMPPSSPTMMALGTLILWFGWYGFNCGSTLMLSANAGNVAAKVAMTTTLAASAGCVTMTLIARLVGQCLPAPTAPAVCCARCVGRVSCFSARLSCRVLLASFVSAAASRLNADTFRLRWRCREKLRHWPRSQRHFGRPGLHHRQLLCRQPLGRRLDRHHRRLRVLRRLPPPAQAQGGRSAGRLRCARSVRLLGTLGHGSLLYRRKC